MFGMDFLSVKIENVKPKAESEEELMDVTEVEVDGCYEDGEIHSDDEKDINVRIPNDEPDVCTRYQPVSVFDKDEVLKKLDRAKRFKIPVRNIEVTELHQDQLSNLYRDLGIDKENERHYRFNAIHMRGTENMSTEDVLQYFEPFSPSCVEWINDVSCNVVWVDDIATARAFLNVSKRIKNLNKVHSNADPFERDFKNDPPGEDPDDDGSIDARSISMAIPPGYWRLGVPCEKGQFLLLRYATRSDKKQRNAEKSSEYYKKHGNPRYGNIPGLISNSLRAQLKKQKFWQTDGVWDRKNEDDDKKNPWKDLAYEWGESDKVEENYFGSIRNKHLENDLLKSDIPDLRISLSSRKARAKRLRAVFETSSNSSDKESWEIRSKVPRMKMYADDEEKKLVKNAPPSSRSRYKTQPIRDLRSKINFKKKEARSNFKSRKQQPASSSELSASEYEYEDGDSGEWALEHYHDLRESLGQNKKLGHRTHKFVKFECESEDDMSNSFEERDLSRRSPLQIEIENDEFYLSKK